MQTFFHKRRYVRCFVVQQDEHHDHDDHHSHDDHHEQEDKEQDEQEQQHSNWEQRLSYLLSGWETLKREDGEVTERIAEHLHAYPDWRLLSCNEPKLKQVALAVEELAEQAVDGLGTLSIETLCWLRSADARPLGRRAASSAPQGCGRGSSTACGWSPPTRAREKGQKSRSRRHRRRSSPRGSTTSPSRAA